MVLAKGIHCELLKEIENVLCIVEIVEAKFSQLVLHFVIEAHCNREIGNLDVEM